MGAIIGLTAQEITDLLFKKVGGFLEIACLNGQRSFVITGEREAVAEALGQAERLGAFKTIRIDTAFGYHTSLLKGVDEELRSFLSSCALSAPQHKILSPVDLSLVGREAVADEIIKNLYSPIRWEALINVLVDRHHIRTGYEIGPGESLAKMAKYINRHLLVHTFEKESLE